MSFPNYFGSLLKNCVFPTKIYYEDAFQAEKKVSLAESKQLTHEVGRPEKWKQNIEVLKDVCNPFLCTYLNEIRANEYSF